eukprot:14840932-Ditylum_brightwellii.AAC.1
MMIDPLVSPYDESAKFGNMDTNCTTKGEPDHRKKVDSVMAARIHGGYKDYVRLMVEKHMQYGQSIKDGDN